MAAGFWAFDDHKISGTTVVAVPKRQEYAGGFRRGDDGGDFRLRPFNKAREIHRKPSAGEDDVGRVFHGAFYIVFVMAAAAHNIDADDAIPCGVPRFFEVFRKDTVVRFEGVGKEIGFIESRLRRRNDADAPFFGHSASKARHADADAHAALDDRNAGGEIADFQCW